MKISTKGEYGLRAMLYIALHGDDGPVTSHQIAEGQAIPESYLRQILAQLARDRLVRSNRGPQGGHVLGRDASRITLRDVLMSLEGRTTSVDQILALPCQVEFGPRYCSIREVLLRVQEAVDGILGDTTLEILASRQREILDKRIEIPMSLPCEDPRPAVALKTR